MAILSQPQCVNYLLGDSQSVWHLVEGVFRHRFMSSENLWAWKTGSSSIFTSQQTKHLSVYGIFEWNFKRYFWNSTQNILYKVESLRTPIYELICVLNTTTPSHLALVARKAQGEKSNDGKISLFWFQFVLIVCSIFPMLADENIWSNNNLSYDIYTDPISLQRLAPNP